MKRIVCISKKLKEFFNEKADKISATTGFIKRKRKLKGSSFIKAIVLGNIGVDNCSIETVCQLLNEDLINITKQGLDFRFTKEAVEFMKRMYNESLTLLKNTLQVDCRILKHFGGVKLLDSSYISLPNSMEDMYKGYGTSYSGYESNTKSGIKLQLVFDYLNQTLDQLNITEGIRSDQGYRSHLSNISNNDLLISDLGYFVPSSFKQINEIGAYFISRYKSDTNIYDIETGQKIDLLEHLGDRSFLEQEVLLGKETRVKVRIIFKKLTEEQAMARRRKANRLARSHGYTSSQRNQKLLNWSIFITNVPKSKINAEQILVVYRIRWQIELLFKLYKSNIRLDKLRGKPYRVLCELYAKLCAILIFHGIVGCTELKKNTELSLTKAFIELKRRVRELFLALNNKIKGLNIFLKKLTITWSQFSLKDKYRKTRVSTLTSLNLL
ncbi:IS4-like element ISWosp7 family transposase [Wolbachia endosymbiont (group B) of Chorthippus brunneus]|uniref:IS4-like element ISWosp7 family transposase n=1 Tax=Wolbachia endosymbiont (group B) of Chorthippus brunneus TaxID=2953996 RepID=UPI0021F8D4D7|nr:IS4-like element ISWosp7 family transposase [Wolbachia endosymbiont (group B) of Chorthippus brunneus]